MKLDGRLGGHLVLGHVDGMGMVRRSGRGREPLVHDWLPGRAWRRFHLQGLGGRGRREPDGGGPERGAVRRADHSLHVRRDHLRPPARRRPRQPRMRHDREVRGPGDGARTLERQRRTKHEERNGDRRRPANAKAQCRLEDVDMHRQRRQPNGPNGVPFAPIERRRSSRSAAARWSSSSTMRIARTRAI